MASTAKMAQRDLRALAERKVLPVLLASAALRALQDFKAQLARKALAGVPAHAATTA